MLEIAEQNVKLFYYKLFGQTVKLKFDSAQCKFVRFASEIVCGRFWKPGCLFIYLTFDG